MPRFKLPDLNNPLTKKRTILTLLTLLSVFIGALTLTFNYFDTAGSCVLCHSMKPNYESWQKSSHAKLPCMSCHAPPGGALSLMMEHVLAGKLVVAEFVTGFHEPINAESEWSQEHMETDQCERCHDLETRVVTPSEAVPNMTSQAHLQHLAAGLRCTTCHNRIAHKTMDDGKIEYEKGEKGDSFKYENFMEMKEGCMRCHNAEKPYTAPNKATAPTACTTCHSKDWEGLPIGHVKGWRTKLHGKVAKSGFGYCLGNKSIDGKMPGCHAATAKFNSEDGKPICARCHDEELVGSFVNQAAKDI